MARGKVTVVSFASSAETYDMADVETNVDLVAFISNTALPPTAPILSN